MSVGHSFCLGLGAINLINVGFQKKRKLSSLFPFSFGRVFPFQIKNISNWNLHGTIISGI